MFVDLNSVELDLIEAKLAWGFLQFREALDSNP